MSRMNQPKIDAAKKIVKAIEDTFNKEVEKMVKAQATKEEIQSYVTSYMEEHGEKLKRNKQVIYDLFDLQEAIVLVLKKEPYYTAFSRMIPKIKTMSIPTMGVAINPVKHKPFMLYNPVFSAFLTDTELKQVVEHEFLHVVLGHITTRKPEDPKDHELHNMGMDLAINEYLPQLPEGCLRVGEGQFKDFPVKKNGEVYIDLLKQQEKEQQSKKGGQEQQQSKGGKGQGQGQQGQGQKPQMTDSSPSDKIKDQQGQVDQHETWQDMPDEVKKELGDRAQAGGEDGQEIQKATGMDDQGNTPQMTDSSRGIAEKKIKEMSKQAVADAELGGNGWGSMPGQLKDMIIDFTRIKVKINWRAILKMAVRGSQKSHPRRTYRRVSKKAPGILPGRIIHRDFPKICIAVDQSGSVSNDLLALMYKVISDLTKEAAFTFVPFDTQVHEEGVEEYDKDSKFRVRQRTWGGTDFSPVAKWAEKKKFDLLIMVTDMEAPKPVNVRGMKRIWICTENDKSSMPFQTTEKIVAISQAELDKVRGMGRDL